MYYRLMEALGIIFTFLLTLLGVIGILSYVGDKLERRKYRKAVKRRTFKRQWIAIEQVLSRQIILVYADNHPVATPIDLFHKEVYTRLTLTASAGVLLF